MEVKAKAKYIKTSPKKIRLVIDIIRGMDVIEALNQLKFVNKKATEPVKKLIDSAIANAVNNFELKKDNLFVKEIRADDGPTLKRWRPRAFGRAGAIRKRSSHISLVLEEKVSSKKDISGKKQKLIDPKKINTIISETIDKKEKKPTNEVELIKTNITKEIFDEKGKHKHNEHIDKLREKEKGSFTKKIFRRKSG